MILTCGKKILKFEVLGKPQPQQRPKFNSFTKSARDPKASVDYKNNVRAMATIAVQQSHWSLCHKDMPIEVTLISYRNIPNSVPLWKKQAAICGLIPPLTKGGDLDNIAKGILDAMTGIVYEDDSQVFKLNCESRYSEQPRVEVEIVGYFTNIGDIKERIKVMQKKGMADEKTVVLRERGTVGRS